MTDAAIPLMIIGRVMAYAAALDTLDWELMRSLILDPIEIDYASLGATHGTLDADAWFERLNALHGFDATQHVVTNLRVVVDGDTAACTSYVNALHFLKDGDREHVAHACGTYIHDFVRTDDGWRIRKATFRLTGHQGGAGAFAEAFARARELAPSRQP